MAAEASRLQTVLGGRPCRPSVVTAEAAASHEAAASRPSPRPLSEGLQVAAMARAQAVAAAAAVACPCLRLPSDPCRTLAAPSHRRGRGGRAAAVDPGSSVDPGGLGRLKVPVAVVHTGVTVGRSRQRSTCGGLHVAAPAPAPVPTHLLMLQQPRGRWQIDRRARAMLLRMQRPLQQRVLRRPRLPLLAVRQPDPATTTGARARGRATARQHLQHPAAAVQCGSGGGLVKPSRIRAAGPP